MIKMISFMVQSDLYFNVSVSEKYKTVNGIEYGSSILKFTKKVRSYLWAYLPNMK